MSAAPESVKETKTKPEREIKITDVGPATVVIKFPEGGGLTVLKGDEGKGKTHTLAAVRRFLGDDSIKLPVRDGKRRGVVESGFARLSISSRTSLTGEVEITSLEGKFEIDKLVDPKIANAERADATRIKALLQLRQVRPNREMFAGLLGSIEELEKHVSPETLAMTDLVDMASKVKRDMDAAARLAEGQAEHARGHAEAAERQAEGVDLEAPHEPQALTQAYEAAIAARATVQSEAKSAEENRVAVQAARDAMDAARKAYAGQTSEELAGVVRQKYENKAMLETQVEGLKDLLREAQEALALAQQAHLSAQEKQALALSHEKSMDAWQRTIDAGAVAGPSPEQLIAADTAVTKAGEAVEQGVKIRAALKATEEARLQKQAAFEHTTRAEKLREAAKATDDVLSEQVKGDPLRVSAGRLVLDTDRGEECFSDLSEGERWKLAIDLALDTVGPWGLIVIPQEAFQGLSPDSKNAIDAHAKLRQIDVLGAYVTRGPLRCEQYEPDEASAQEALPEATEAVSVRSDLASEGIEP